MGQTTNYSIPYPDTDDPRNIPEDMKNMGESIDTLIKTLKHKYTLTLTADVSAGTNVTIPCYYEVGSNVLDVYLNGERLLLSSDTSGTDGHYVEVGTSGETSNIIKSTTDWSLSSGDYLEFIVKGEYSE